MLMMMLIAAAVLEPGARGLLPTMRDAPGCALDVRRGGQVVEADYTGLANLEDGTAIVSDTVFEIGSVSKQFIGAGLAILAERGRLRLDDPISKWLPELPPLYRDVTIAMLAHHTSGIRSWNNLAELTGRGEDSTGYDNAWVLAAVARQQRLNNAPGAEYLYSNSNFVLAAIIVERASGQPLNDFYHEALFLRLGMAHTRWRTDFREIVSGRAQAYLPNDHGGWQLDMPLNGVAGAGGLLSTTGDLQRWNAALADPAPEDRTWVTALLRPGALADGVQLRYGLGIETGLVEGLAAWSHAGSTASYRAWLSYIPSQRLSVALLCNSGAVDTEELGPKVAARFLPTPAESAAPITLSRPAPAGEVISLAGIYRNIANDSVVEAKADASGLHLNGGPGFAVNKPDSLVTHDGRRTLTLNRDRSGVVTGMTVSRIGNSPTVLARTAPWKPTAADAARLSGGFASADVDGVQYIEVGKTGLIWRDPSGTAHTLVPIYRNAFEAPDASWVLRFQTSSRGEVLLDMSITRARRIAFHRTVR
jgi:CubicO group peptidase (beta-lactamase class C family)